MGLLSRYTLKVFGGTANVSETGVFGSEAAGSAQTSLVPATIESLAAWDDGWFSAIIAGQAPSINDTEGLAYVLSYNQNYQMQQGVPQYDSGTTYGSYSVVQQSGVLYMSTTLGGSAGFSGQPTSNGSYWAVIGAGGAPTQTILTSGSGTYTTPARCKYLVIQATGGGGGGAGSGNSGTNGGNGSDTKFGGSLVVAQAGAATTTNGAVGGVGGAGSVGVGVFGYTVTGNNGAPATSFSSVPATGVIFLSGGFGGGNPLGMGGVPGGIITNPTSGTGTGSGGGGGQMSTDPAVTTVGFTGGGGGAGGYTNGTITNPAASYSYVIGTGGAGGVAGTNGVAGAAGRAGVLIITEYYS